MAVAFMGQFRMAEAASMVAAGAATAEAIDKSSLMTFRTAGAIAPAVFFFCFAEEYVYSEYGRKWGAALLETGLVRNGNRDYNP